MSDQDDSESIGLTRIIVRRRAKPLYEQVYERWYRARGQNPKITLRQVCDAMNVNYDSIRVLRSRNRKRKKRG